MSQNNGPSGRKLEPSIVAALIGVAGTIIVTLISILAPRFSSPPTTQAPPTVIVVTATTAPTIVPTDAVPPGESTSTPAPETPTPPPTATFFPIGLDWESNCISSNWTYYPPKQLPVNDGCFQQPFEGFFTSAGRLGFTYNDGAESAQFYGVFARLPADGIANINFQLKEITKGNVLIGVFSQADVNSTGAVLFIPSSSNVRSQRMLLKTMPGSKTFSQSTGPIDSGTATYDATFDFTGGTVKVNLKNRQVDLGSVPVLSAEKWLFLGYQVLNGPNRIQAEFFDLVITER